jgi:hypothetical protein
MGFTHMEPVTPNNAVLKIHPDGMLEHLTGVVSEAMEGRTTISGLLR